MPYHMLILASIRLVVLPDLDHVYDFSPHHTRLNYRKYDCAESSMNHAVQSILLT